MDSKSLIEWLSGISLGTFIAWLLVISAFLTAICTGAIKLYKIFAKYRNAKDENEKLKIETKSNSEQLDKINTKLDNLADSFAEQKLINYKQTRYSIVQGCNEALINEKITAVKYKSLMEMYDEYTAVFADMHPNGYVHKLIEKVSDPNQVEIVGNVDE